MVCNLSPGNNDSAFSSNVSLGVGENVRGSTMNALDSVFGRGHPENEAIVNRGREETQRGLDNMNRLDDGSTRLTTSQNPSMQNPTYHDTAPSGAATRLVTEPAGTRVCIIFHLPYG